VAGGAFLGWIISLLKWFKLKEAFFAGIITERGGVQWGVFILFFGLSIFGGLVVFNAFSKKVTLDDVRLGLIYLIWTGLAELLTLLALILRPGPFDLMGMNWLIWTLAFIVGAIPMVGAVLKVQKA
jgi:hypothetical protein